MAEGMARRWRVGLSRFIWVLGLLAIVGVSAACTVSMAPAPGTSTTGTGGVVKGTFTTDVKVVRNDSGATMVLVPVTIDGHGPYDFALDTGASVTLVDTSTSHRVGLTVAGGRETVSGVGGSESVTPVNVANWSAGGIPLPDTIIAEADLDSAQGDTSLHGLLGSDILSQFGTIKLDYNAQTLTVSS